MDKHIFVAHLAHNEGWSSLDIATYLSLGESTVGRILAAVSRAGILPREPEVDLEDLLPDIFHDA